MPLGAQHSSINSIEDLSEVVRHLDEDSLVLKEMKLHRIKCSAIIKNVIAYCVFEELLEDIGDSYYSVISDESTSIDVKKMLCLMLRYYSKSKKKIVTTFYKLIQLHGGTADDIAGAIKTELKSDKLSLDKFLGLGVDDTKCQCWR